MSHPEGYIEPDGVGGYNYVYQYKDHLGNIRLSYSDNSTVLTDNSFDSTTENWGVVAAVLSQENGKLKAEVTGQWAGAQKYVDVAVGDSIYYELLIDKATTAKLALLLIEHDNDYATLKTTIVNANADGFLSGTYMVTQGSRLRLKVAKDNGGDLGITTHYYLDDVKMIKKDIAVREESNYYPFGLVQRGYNSSTYGVKNNLKTYQGQEFTEDLGLNTHEWKYRISDPTIGRFWQIDPLAEDYVYNGTYNFAENRVIDGFELEGLEWVDSKFDRLADAFHEQRASSPPLSEQSKQNFKNVVNGTGNIAAGVVGTIGSIIYIGGTSGVGAALGGAAALTFSITEIGIGMSQIADAIANDSGNTALQNSSSLPGLIAHEAGSEHAELIDAAGQFIPGMLTGGNIKTIMEGPTTIMNSPDAKNAVINALEVVDAVLDTKGLVDAVVGTTTNNGSQTTGNSNTTQEKPKIVPISSDLAGAPNF